MKKSIFFILFSVGLTMAQTSNFAGQLYNGYENYKESTITTKRIRHSIIVPLINRHKENPLFEISTAGVSPQGREIYLISAGTGKTRIFMWSQMHGDEPTATMAIFDMLNFLSANDHLNNYRQKILENVTIYFMPMVNPDGAELFKRRNSFDIDINRDASRNTTPEARTLNDIFLYLKADFGFNLHDQSIYTAAGRTHRSAAISFLAPAINYEKNVDSVRLNAMHLISELYSMLQEYIPGHIGRYDDGYEPRAFGDNFQKMGTSTILVETGGWRNDPEKQFLRKINFILLSSAILSIADQSYKKTDVNIYEQIPYNEDVLKDLLLRNMTYRKDSIEVKIDISADRVEKSMDGKILYNSVIDDAGDLSTLYGYEDHDFTGYEIHPGKIYASKKSPSVLKNDFIDSLLAQGYTDIFYEGKMKSAEYEFPLNITRDKNYRNNISIGSNASFYLTKDDKVQLVFVNGFMYDVENKISLLKNSAVKGSK